MWEALCDIYFDVHYLRTNCINIRAIPMNELTRMRVPGRKAGLISGRSLEFWEKIEGSAEALWASHSPMPIPPRKNLATKPNG